MLSNEPYGCDDYTFSLAPSAISLLCLFAWRASLINIRLISRTAFWPLIIPVLLLALHRGNPVQLIHNSSRGRQQMQNMQKLSSIQSLITRVNHRGFSSKLRLFHCWESKQECHSILLSPSSSLCDHLKNVNTAKISAQALSASTLKLQLRQPQKHRFRKLVKQTQWTKCILLQGQTCKQKRARLTLH